MYLFQNIQIIQETIKVSFFLKKKICVGIIESAIHRKTSFFIISYIRLLSLIFGMMNIVQTVKDKKTGELYTLTSMSFGGRDSTTIGLRSQCAEKVEIPYNEFIEGFEPVDVDITPAIESFESMVEVDIRLKKMVMSILRRNHAGGYYHLGCLVYIDYENSLNLLPPNRTRDYGLDLFGPENPYIIVKIDKNGIHIRRYKYVEGVDYLTPDKYGYIKEDFVLNVSPQPSEADAFSCLIRYDQPY